MMKKIAFVIFCFFPLTLFAQYSETIRSGRPGQAIGAYTVGKNVFQVQSGITHQQADFNTNTKSKTWIHSTVVRLGMIEKLEVSGVINWQRDDITSPEEGLIFAGVSNTQIGARYNITKK